MYLCLEIVELLVLQQDHPCLLRNRDTHPLQASCLAHQLQDFGIEGLGFGLGVSVMADEDAALIPGHNGDFWWSGAHGTHFWISPETGVVVVVLLQNAMGPHAGMPVAPYLVQGLAN